MYVGRLLVVAPGLVAYRVSSRSFPNRRTYARGPDRIAVGPTEDAPEPDNPYVAYDCLRAVEGPAGPVAVAGNGSHVDPVAEKVERGYPARDALAHALLALDFEKDEYDTPRIAAVAGPAGAHAGIVRRDALLVEAVTEPTLVATYERDRPEPFAFPVADASDPDPDPGAAARAAYDLDFEHPVCAAAAVVDEREDGGEDADAVTLGRYDGPGSESGGGSDTAGGTGDG